MSRLASVLDLIGNTPVVDVSSFSPTPGVRILAKLEGQMKHSLLDLESETGKLSLGGLGGGDGVGGGAADAPPPRPQDAPQEQTEQKDLRPAGDPAHRRPLPAG